jgi:lysozyme
MPTRHGIDVSHHQNQAGPIDWNAVRGAGVEFVFVKVSDGLGYDAYASSNISHARAAGLMVGGYHYLRNTSPGDQQASVFLARAPLQPGDLLPVLDFEVEIKSAVAKAAYVAKARHWMTRVSGAIGGRAPFLYTRRSIMSQLGNPADLARHPLWLARYSKTPPQLPHGATEYIIWQYSEKGSVPGITGHVDLNECAIGPAQLRADYTL